jgi:hypothetical protein
MSGRVLRAKPASGTRPAEASPEGLGKSHKLGDGKQLIRRLVQTPTGSALVREMPHELSGQSVNVRASKIVELSTPKAENTGSADDRDLDALAVEDISVHEKSCSPSP